MKMNTCKKTKRKQERSKSMGKATTIMRSSIFTYLNLPSSTSTLLALPFALAALLAPPLVSSSRHFPPLHARLSSLALAAGLPPSSDLFAVLNLKLSQTLLSFLFLLPFTLSSLLLAKASVVNALFRHSTFLGTLYPLLLTQFCNSLVVLSANATCFCLLIVFFDVSDVVGIVASSSPRAILVISAVGAVFYSIVVANAHVVCSLAMVVAGAEGRGGVGAVLKGCVLVVGGRRTGTALSLAVPVNAALAGVEALFQYRVVRAYNRAVAVDVAVALEAVIVAYMYAAIVVLDTIVWSVFLKSCGPGYVVDRNRNRNRNRRDEEEGDDDDDESSFFGKEKAKFEFLL